MKDKSRYVSSVIVSLFAGFIYFLAGESIPVKIERSVQAVFSNDVTENYLTTECFSFNEVTNKNNIKSGKHNSRFYIKYKSKNDLKNDNSFESYTDGDFSGNAKFIRPTPDRNVDFTSELEKLINNGSVDCLDTELKKTGNYSINQTLSCNENQIAEAERNFKRIDRVDKSNSEFSIKYNKGNGFKYNELTEVVTEFNETGETIVIFSSSDTKQINTVTVKTQLRNRNKNINKNCNINRVRSEINNLIDVTVPNIDVRVNVTDNEEEDAEDYYYENEVEEEDEDHESDCSRNKDAQQNDSFGIDIY